MSDVPLASYEDPRWMPTNITPVGTRGATGNLAVLTTNTTIANTDLVITTKDCAYANDPPIKVQYAVLANGAPQGLYEDGIPAVWSPLPTDLGFMIIMKRPGPQGNSFTLTLVNPGRVSPLKIARPAAKNIVITLAHTGGANPTTTPAQLIAAINGDSELSEYMMAFASSAGPATLPAFATKAFTGGTDVPGLVLVSLVNTAGASTATGLGVMNLLNGSRYVSAKVAGASNNGGTVLAMPAITMTGPTAVSSPITPPTLILGSANRGEVSDQFLARRKAWSHRRRAGDPLGKETNKTLQLRSTRFGAMRNYQRVPKQDRAIATSRFQNYATDTLAAKSLG